MAPDSLPETLWRDLALLEPTSPPTVRISPLTLAQPFQETFGSSREDFAFPTGSSHRHL